jgi:hypothetical protein
MSFYLMHRGWLDHDVFGDPEREPLCKRAAWAWLIDHAEYAVKQVRIGRTLVTLQRGQLSYSLRFLGKSWGWHYLRVRRFLTDLAERNMIETVCETGRETAQTILTICNYERYQAPTHEARNSPRNRPRRKRETNNKEEKEESLSVDPDGSTVADATDPPSDAVRQIWNRGPSILGDSSRGLLGKSRRDYGDLAVVEALLATERACASEPVEFFIGCLKQQGPRHASRTRSTPLANFALAAPIAVERFLQRQRDSGICDPPDVPLLGGRRDAGSADLAA